MTDPTQGRSPIETESQAEHWDWQRLSNQMLEAARLDTVGLCEYEQLPGSIEFAGIGNKTKKLAREFASSDHEAAFYLQAELERGAIMTPKVIGTGYRIDDTRIMSLPNMSIVTPEATIARLEAGPFTDIEAYERAFAKYQQAENVVKFLYSDDPDAAFLRRHTFHAVGSAHTHPDNITFSTSDIQSLLAIPRINTHLLASPDGTMYCLLTTNQTDWLDMKNIDLSKNGAGPYREWQTAVEQRVKEWLTRPGNTLTPEQLYAGACHGMVKTKARKHKVGYYKTTSPEDDRLIRVV